MISIEIRQEATAGSSDSGLLDCRWLHVPYNEPTKEGEVFLRDRRRSTFSNEKTYASKVRPSTSHFVKLRITNAVDLASTTVHASHRSLVSG